MSTAYDLVTQTEVVEATSRVRSHTYGRHIEVRCGGCHVLRSGRATPDTLALLTACWLGLGCPASKQCVLAYGRQSYGEKAPCPFHPPPDPRALASPIFIKSRNGPKIQSSAFLLLSICPSPRAQFDFRQGSSLTVPKHEAQRTLCMNATRTWLSMG